MPCCEVENMLVGIRKWDKNYWIVLSSFCQIQTKMCLLQQLPQTLFDVYITQIFFPFIWQLKYICWPNKNTRQTGTPCERVNLRWTPKRKTLLLKTSTNYQVHLTEKKVVSSGDRGLSEYKFHFLCALCSSSAPRWEGGWPLSLGKSNYFTSRCKRTKGAIVWNSECHKE